MMALDVCVCGAIVVMESVRNAKTKRWANKTATSDPFS